ARRDGRRPDDDLSFVDGQEPELLDVECGGMTNEAAERAARLRAGDDAGRLRLQRRTSAECSGTGGGTCLEQMSARQARHDRYFLLPALRLAGFDFFF